MRIVALILAAGSGRRMGGPKALLSWRKRSFLERCAQALARPEVESVLAVIGFDAPRVRALAASASIECVENACPERGMLSSIWCGLDAAEARGADAVLVHPVDHPLVSAATVEQVI